MPRYRDFTDSTGPQVVLPRLPIRLVLIIIGILAVLMLIFTSFYTVNPEEVGVVVRFGKYCATTNPGLHFKLPFGVDKVSFVPVQRQEKQEFGFRTQKGDVLSKYTDYHQEPELLRESLMVTGDLNAAMVEWIVQYRIKDPRQYLFSVLNPVETLRAASESAMREAVGDHTVDEVLTVGRTEISNLAERNLQRIIDEYKMGVEVERVVLQDVNPPDPVKASFNGVNQAQQERERTINEAWAQYNQVVPRAKGEAQQVLSEAQGYAIKRVNEAKGEAVRFSEVFNQYLKAPEVTRERMYLETMGEVFPKLGQKFIMDETGQGVLPLMDLNNLPAAASTVKGGAK